MSDTLSAIITTGGFIGFIALFLLLMKLLPSKGEVGEKRVSHKLEGLPADRYIVLNDVILPTKNGTTQIDHIVVSIYGVFVIETKFYNGWIYGGEDSEYWTQNIYGEKHQFYNPILQNGGHVRMLKYILSELGDIPFYPIVTFSKQADLKINTTFARVIYWNNLVDEIKSHSSECLSWNDVNKIRREIQKVMLDSKSKDIKNQHISNVVRARIRKETAIESGKCPRCGGTLVLRNGKYGQFYGCSNYPRCKYTIER